MDEEGGEGADVVVGSSGGVAVAAKCRTIQTVKNKFYRVERQSLTSLLLGHRRHRGGKH